MKYALLLATGLLTFPALQGEPGGDPLIEGFRLVEVASVADAMEQLYGQRAYMSHEMRPLFPTKFAGPAVTVLMKKEEHKEGAPASQGMLDAMILRFAGDAPLSPPINARRIGSPDKPMGSGRAHCVHLL